MANGELKRMEATARHRDEFGPVNGFEYRAGTPYLPDFGGRLVVGFQFFFFAQWVGSDLTD